MPRVSPGLIFDRLALAFAGLFRLATSDSTTGGGGGGGDGPSLLYLAFDGRGSRLRAMTAAGRFVELEWDSANEAYIEGPGRDGGEAMPTATYSLGIARGQRRRLRRVGVDRTNPLDTVKVVSEIRGLPSETSTALPNHRWAAFSPMRKGSAHEVTLQFEEDVEGIEGVEVQFDELSEGYNR